MLFAVMGAFHPLWVVYFCLICAGLVMQKLHNPFVNSPLNVQCLWQSINSRSNCKLSQSFSSSSQLKKAVRYWSWGQEWTSTLSVFKAKYRESHTFQRFSLWHYTITSLLNYMLIKFAVIYSDNGRVHSSQWVFLRLMFKYKLMHVYLPYLLIHFDYWTFTCNGVLVHSEVSTCTWQVFQHFNHHSY